MVKFAEWDSCNHRLPACWLWFAVDYQEHNDRNFKNTNTIAEPKRTNQSEKGKEVK